MNLPNNFSNPPKTTFWSLPISIITLENCTLLIRSWALKRYRKRIYCCAINDIVYALEHPDGAERLKNADIVTPDGMPIVWRLKQKGVHVNRVYGPDIMTSVLKKTEHLPIKHFFYGSSESTLNKLKRELNRQFPSCRLAGFISPPFRKLSNEEKDFYIKSINKSSPNILWIGLGTQKQIRLASQWSDLLNPCVIITVGAAFDFLARTKPQAPIFIRKIGLEWLFRLINEPKRLWRRYFNNIFKFCYFLFKYGLP